MKTRLLSAEDVHSILMGQGIDSFLDKLIEGLHSGFAELANKSARIPPRTGIHYHNPDLGLLEWMPASIDEGTATLKIVGYHPSNPDKRDLPTILSSIAIFDTDTGHLRGLLDGTLPTAIRTGAMSAVATRALFRNQSSIKLGIYGCGAQAVTQAHALSRIYEIEEIFAFDIDPEAVTSLEQRINFIDTKVTPISTERIDTLLSESDVICTCTSAEPGSGPLFADFKNLSGSHINAVGSDFPEKIELPVGLLKRAFVCPDFLKQAKAEGECQQLADSDIACELSQLLGNPQLQEKAKSQLSVFDSTGHAYADYLTGQVFFDAAVEMGLGTNIQLESVPLDPKNPYSSLSLPNLVSKKQPRSC